MKIKPKVSQAGVKRGICGYASLLSGHMQGRGRQSRARQIQQLPQEGSAVAADTEQPLSLEAGHGAANLPMTQAPATTAALAGNT